MKKIEPAGFVNHNSNNGETQYHPAQILGNGCHHVWTDDALQAVAEAVRDACEMVRYDLDQVRSIDIAAIINQLKG